MGADAVKSTAVDTIISNLYTEEDRARAVTEEQRARALAHQADV